MAKIVNALKPILFAFLESAEVKALVIELLQRYSASTKNKIDDTIVALVRSKLLP